MVFRHVVEFSKPIYSNKLLPKTQSPSFELVLGRRRKEKWKVKAKNSLRRRAARDR
jgi:hypothetical protein